MTPESPTEIRSFLGLAGYYRRETYAMPPVLALPDGPEDFVVYCDAIKTRFWERADAAGQSYSICVKTVEEA
ncbi:hypothetical protein Tco_0228573 [Tanacetum coccineum]